MANIFRKKDSYIDRVNRSTFDLSFVNNLTMKFGAITPVCLLPASFGDSFQINARFNLQLLPTVFPIQTQLYVRLHFVYVRTRTLWEDWMAFFGGDETVTPPWMDVLADDFTPERRDKFNIPNDMQIGSLADYLGVPTTLVGNYGAEKPVSVDYGVQHSGTWGGSFLFDNIDGLSRDEAVSTISSLKGESIPNYGESQPSDASSANAYLAISYKLPLLDSGVDSPNTALLTLRFLDVYHAKDFWRYGFFVVTSSTTNKILDVFTLPVIPTTAEVSYSLDVSSYSTDVTIYVVTPPRNASSLFWKDEYLIQYLGNPTYYKLLSPGGHVAITSSNCPFYTSQDQLPPIPLSALPFRAYEAYYNAFGRDIRNNPFIVNGKPEYNKYVPTLKGGKDSYKYQLHYANWEPDAYTTALQSPQAGIAPLVGITSLGEATFRDAAGTEYHAQLETAEDGDTVTGFQVKSSNAPADVVRNLIGMATSGISISDFRNVNSLQRFLEIRIRQSPRYKNLVKGLFDVNLDYDELMMPEFLGGISDTIPVYKVTQTTPTEGNPLGSFAGQGSLQSGMRHVIRKYCPEDGYILGVMSVVPAANYSQLLAPHFTRMNLLDWHFPQFNNISYQPMLYKHLCPYQAYAANPQSINNVFGYQRAYWDLISSFDEVHGEFRGSMRNFLINRVFDKAPELSKDFLLVNPDHVNDVFAMTAENGDKILGSIAFDITKKTTIPRNSIPHIE